MEHSKAITKKLKDEIFIWDPTAYSNKGYWYVLGTTGAFGRPASKVEVKKLGKPPASETEPVSPQVFEEEVETKEPKKLTKSDEYRKAKRDTRTPLGEMIFKKTFEEGESLGSAIKSSISDKLTSKTTGLKEKFDPLNLSRALFGDKITAVLGRKFGRDDEDIEYFTGYKNKTASEEDSTSTKIGKLETESIDDALHTKVGSGNQTKSRAKDSVSTVLAKLYNLIKNNHDEEIKLHEIERNQKKEQDKLKDVWNKELIQALTAQKDTGENLKVTSFNKFEKDLVKKLKKMAEAIAGGVGGNDLFKKLKDKLTLKSEKKAAEAALKAGATIGEKELVKTAEKVGEKEITKSAEKVLGKSVLKSVLKKLPFGLGVLGALPFAVGKFMDGDKKGAAAEVASGAAGAIPVAGTAVSIAADMAIAARDVYKDAFGVQFEDDDPKLRKQRMDMVTKVIKSQLSKEVKPDEKKEGETPTATPVEEPKKEVKSTATPAEAPKEKDKSKPKDFVTKDDKDNKKETAQPVTSAAPSKESKKETDAPEVKAPPGPTATTATPAETTPKTSMAPQAISENNDLMMENGTGNGTTVLADNSSKVNIVNNNSDGLLVEQITGVRHEDTTLKKINKLNLRLV